MLGCSCSQIRLLERLEPCLLEELVHIWIAQIDYGFQAMLAGNADQCAPEHQVLV